jgi:DNA transposition AAA+ family ATPase
MSDPTNDNLDARRDDDDGGQRQAMDSLNEQSRVLKGSRMTDRSKPLTPAQVDEIRQRLRDYMGQRKLHQSIVAKQCGYSPPVLTEWLKGRYAGNVELVAHAVNDWMERDRRREEAKTPRDFIPTKIADDIRSVVYLADKRGMMAAIVAPSGTGKTFVLKVLVAELRGLYVYCHGGMTPRELLNTMAVQLGRKSRDVTRADQHRWLVATMKDTHRLIVLDEAHQLGAALNVVRALHDEAGVPVVMAGTAEILEAVNDRSDGRGQFSSRTIRYNALDHLVASDAPGGGAGGKGGAAVNLFSESEVRAYFDMKKMRIDSDGLRLLWAMACLIDYGCIRFAEHVAETAMEIKRRYAEPLTRKDLLTALKMLHGDVEAGYVRRLTDQQLQQQQTRTARVA